MIRFLLPLAAILAAGGAAPLLARDADASVVVNYADLGLGHAPGEAAPDVRVTRAVLLVCGEAEARDLARRAEVRHCRKAAADAAAPRIATAIEGDRGLAAGTSSIRVAAS